MIDPGQRMRNRLSLLRLCLPRVAQAAADEKGAVSIEAAIIFPILITIFFGMIEFSDAFTAKRRVQTVASTTADLVAQAKSVSTSDLADIASVGAQLMLPFASSGLTLKIVSVSEDSQSKIAEEWSCAWSSISAAPACAATGAAYTAAPSGILRAGESIIIGEATYAFKPTVGLFLLGGATFKASAYFRPRLVPSVPLQ
jgi:Flp pilus assembly protein TadG